MQRPVFSTDRRHGGEMTVLKVVGGLLITAVLLFLFVANFSVEESRFECDGQITTNGTEQPATLFFKLEKYRWWVKLWSDSRGSAWVELPNQTVSYFGRITEAGDLLHFWDSPGKFSGNFSTLSGAVGVDLGAFGVFDGTCRGVRE
jgi:hypothetical protein